MFLLLSRYVQPIACIIAVLCSDHLSVIRKVHISNCRIPKPMQPITSNPFYLVVLKILQVILAPFTGVRMMLIKLLVVLEDKNKPEESLRWLFAVHSFVEEWIDRKALEWGNGVHIKHELMEGIHSFFYSRIPEGSTVLDIGCGYGALADSIAANVTNVRVIGIDANRNHIEMAKSMFLRDNLLFIAGDATSSLPQEKIDSIVMSSVLEHLEDRPEFLQQLVVRYAPKLFLIRVPTVDRHFHSAMKKKLGVFHYVDKDHKTEYTVESFRCEIEQAGLKIDSLEVRWGDIWAVCRSCDFSSRSAECSTGSLSC